MVEENKAAAPIRIVEVGPRDGLQNEQTITATSWKVELVDRLSATGLKHIEVGSFVSPARVPQMAGSIEVFQGIEKKDGISYRALVPNLKGLHRALEAKASEVAIFISAAEGFSRNNLNCTIAESIANVADIIAVADHVKCPVRGYISCITHCPFDGKVNPHHVASLTGRLIDAGCYEVSLGDTIGKANTDDISALLDAVCTKIPAENLASHFHDTNNNALANVEVSLGYGIRAYDAAIAGLGGCPFAPGAPGNLDTGKLVGFLESKGYQTGIDMQSLAKVEEFVRSTIKPKFL